MSHAMFIKKISISLITTIISTIIFKLHDCTVQKPFSAPVLILILAFTTRTIFVRWAAHARRSVKLSVNDQPLKWLARICSIHPSLGYISIIYTARRLIYCAVEACFEFLLQRYSKRSFACREKEDV